MYFALGLQMLTKSTATTFGGDYLDKSLHDVLNPHIELDDAQEIINDVVAKAGIKLT